MNGPLNGSAVIFDLDGALVGSASDIAVPVVHGPAAIMDSIDRVIGLPAEEATAP